MRGGVKKKQRHTHTCGPGIQFLRPSVYAGCERISLAARQTSCFVVLNYQCPAFASLGTHCCVRVQFLPLWYLVRFPAPAGSLGQSNLNATTRERATSMLRANPTKICSVGWACAISPHSKPTRTSQVYWPVHIQDSVIHTHAPAV